MGVSVLLGRTGLDLCPVSAILGYMVRQGAGPGIFFQFEDACNHLVARKREALKHAAIDADKFAGHSFQMGVATTAAQKGLADNG